MKPGKSIVDRICEPVKQKTLLHVNGRISAKHWQEALGTVVVLVGHTCSSIYRQLIFRICEKVMAESIKNNTTYYMILEVRSFATDVLALNRVSKSKVSYIKAHKKKYNYE